MNEAKEATLNEKIALTPDEIAQFIAEGLHRAGRLKPSEVVHVKWVFEGIPLLLEDMTFIGASVERLGTTKEAPEC